MFINRVLTVCVIAWCFVILGTGVAGLPSTMGAPSAAQSIVGSWSNEVIGLSTYAPGEPALFAFTSDGNVVVLFASGIGAWARTGDHTVAATWVSNRYDAAGRFIGISKFQAAITLNATFDGYTASIKRDRFDPQGTLTDTANFSLKATRILVESL